MERLVAHDADSFAENVFNFILNWGIKLDFSLNGVITDIKCSWLLNYYERDTGIHTKNDVEIKT